ncbi:tudor and KH domain-containing protein-like [Carcharodon carcharias]|uniref:tudor and KH domain-containing protein-like n=1 Tax=Carcharodon carcharias TaxID=13397 RepID=UPI001B7DA7E7|nr:tudor and KH domain-containing protein-like [Carcharodon carcharias]
MSAGSAWRSLTATQKAMLMIGVPASAVAVYILYRRYREKRDEHCVLVGDDQIAMDMKVPRDAVKIIIGRQGSTIKQLRKETGARIEVEASEEMGGYEGTAERLLTIIGSPVQVCKAKVAIHQLLAESVKITEELQVPHRAVGRIIGRGGESIREICRTTGAKIVCEETGKQLLDLSRSVRISGTRQEVASAKTETMIGPSLKRVTEEGAGHERGGVPPAAGCDAQARAFSLFFRLRRNIVAAAAAGRRRRRRRRRRQPSNRSLATAGA